MEYNDHEKDIPIWFNGTQRWMAGLTRRTTCDDVIYAILYSSGLHEAESTDNFAIFEKWREVERPLSSRTKILKVWAFWGEEQPNVNLTMRSLNDYFLPGESSLYMRSRRRHKKSSRQRSRHSPNCKCPDRHACGECSRLKSLEHLVKLVVSQERKLQDITDRILDTDRLIEKHEGRIHEHRVQQNGMDYVQDSYLNSHSSGSGSSSSLDSACLSVATLDLNEARRVFSESSLAELGEITRMCDQLTHLERRLTVERAKAEELEPEVRRLRKEKGQEEKEEELQNAELEEARVQLLRAVTTHVNHEYNERMLDRKMETCLTDVEDRVAFLQTLQSQLSDVESRLTSSVGNESVHLSDSDTPVYPTDADSIASCGVTPVSGSQTAPRYEDTSRPGIMNSKNSQRTTSHSLDIVKNIGQSFERNIPNSPKDNNTMVINHNNPVTKLQSSTDKSSPVNKVGKSMTGRGRFAKEHTVRSGTNLLVTSSTEQQLGEASSLPNSEALYEGQNDIASCLSLQTSTRAESRVNAMSLKSHLNPPNGVISHSLATGRSVDKANVDRAKTMVNTSKGSARGYSNNPMISQGPAASSLDHGSFSSNGNTNLRGSGLFTRLNTPLKDSVVNSVGSCGDLRSPRAESSLSGTQPFSREGRARTGIRGGERQTGQSAFFRRSRSADRDRPAAQAQRSRMNAAAIQQLNLQYYNGSEEFGRQQPYKINEHPYKQNGWPSEHGSENMDARERYSQGRRLEFKQKINSYKSSMISAQSTISPTNNQNTFQQNVNMGSKMYKVGDGYNAHTMYHNHTVNSQQQNGQNHFHLDEQSHDRLDKKHDRSKVESSGAEKGELSVHANKGKRQEGNESIAVHSTFSLNTSSNSWVKPHVAPNLATKNDAMFAHGIVKNSQTIMPDDAPFHVNQQPGKQKLNSQNNIAFTTLALSSNHATSNSKEDLRSNLQFTNNTNLPSNQSQSNQAKGSVEANSSRGALFHIVSQKLNASKEKIRLNSMSTSKTSQQGQFLTSNGEKEATHSQAAASNANSATHRSAHPSSYQNGQNKNSFGEPSESGRPLVLPTSTGPGHFPVSVPNGKRHGVSSNSDKQQISGRFTPSPSSQNLLPPASEKTSNGKDVSQIKSDMCIDNHDRSNPQRQGYQRKQQETYQYNEPIQNTYSYPKSQQHVHHPSCSLTSGSVDNTPYRRSALNPHFCDVTPSCDNKTGTKYSVRTWSSQQSKKGIPDGSIGLIDYHDNGIISNLHNHGSFPQNMHNGLPPSSVSRTMNINGRLPVPMFTSIPNSDYLDMHDSRKAKTKMEDSNDSDTGLSSMHSDEAANMETLV